MRANLPQEKVIAIAPLLVGVSFFIGCGISQANAAVTLVQENPTGLINSGSFGQAFNTNVATSDTIVILTAAAHQDFTTSSIAVSDSLNNHFTVVTSTFAGVAGMSPYGMTTQIAYATDTPSGADTVTVTWNINEEYNWFDILELTPSSLDFGMASTSNSNSINLTAGVSSTIANGEFGVGIGEVLTGHQTLTPGSGWTSFDPYAGNSISESQEYIAQSSPGSISGTFTSGVAAPWTMSMAAFKSATDITPPSVAFVSPVKNATVSSTITLIASSTDDFAVSSTAFYAGPFGATLASSTLIGSTSTPSGTLYSIPWNTTSVTNGSTTLWTLATDTSNNTSSASTTLNVENPPVISGISTSTSLASATITWTTNTAASSQVNYGLTASYGSSTATATLVTSHSLTLANLTSGTPYHYQIVSTDAQNNTSTTGDGTFTTPALPSITSFSASPGSVVSGNSATLAWTTSNAASLSIDQGIGSENAISSGSISVSPSLTTIYTLTATNTYGTSTASATVTVTTPTPSTQGSVVDVAAGYVAGQVPLSIPSNPSLQNDSNTTPNQNQTPSAPSLSSLQTQLTSIQTMFANLVTEIANTHTAITTPFIRNLQLNSQGADVERLQEYLIQTDTGPAAKNLAAQSTSQNFGMFTYHALVEFQEAVGLPGTGYFGPKTRSYINSRL